MACEHCRRVFTWWHVSIVGVEGVLGDVSIMVVVTARWPVAQRRNRWRHRWRPRVSERLGRRVRWKTMELKGMEFCSVRKFWQWFLLIEKDLKCYVEKFLMKNAMLKKFLWILLLLTLITCTVQGIYLWRVRQVVLHNTSVGIFGGRFQRLAECL